MTDERERGFAEDFIPDDDEIMIVAAITGEPAPPTGDPERCPTCGGIWARLVDVAVNKAQTCQDPFHDPAPPTGDREHDQATDEAMAREREADRSYAEHERRAGRGERPEDVVRGALLWQYAGDHERADLDEPLAALDALVAERDRAQEQAIDAHRALAAERVRADGLADLLRFLVMQVNDVERTSVIRESDIYRRALAADPEGGSTTKPFSVLRDRLRAEATFCDECGAQAGHQASCSRAGDRGERPEDVLRRFMRNVSNPMGELAVGDTEQAARALDALVAERDEARQSVDELQDELVLLSTTLAALRATQGGADG